MDNFIKCPNCQQSVPAGFGTCQFCKASLQGVVRPNHQRKNYFAYEDDHSTQYFGKPTWVKPAYTALCFYFIVSAVVGMVQVFSSFKGDLEPFKIMGIAIHAIGLVVGIGLLAKIEFIRNLVTFTSGIKIIFGLIGLPGAVLTAPTFGLMGIVYVILAVLDIATNALMIYLIGETD
jgi:hypothetical protein